LTGKNIVKDNLTKVIVITTILVIALGGTIRIYDAGESCPDWPLCFGTFGFDISEEEQEKWWEENPDEIDSRGSGHRYTTFEIFTEWIHRFLAGMVLGPLVILNWYILRDDARYGKEMAIATKLSVILILWQGAVGMLTVKMDNEHWSVILHLGSALAFMMSLIWTWAIISRRKETDWISFDPEISAKWKNTLLIMSSFTLFTLFSGTLVSTSPGANYGCGINGFYDSWPLCQGELLSKIAINEIVAKSQMIHRWVVGLVGILFICVFLNMWYFFSKQNKGDILLIKWIFAATFSYIVNILLGGLYVLSWSVDGYLEILSLIHLLLASTSFVLLATVCIGILIVLKDDNKGPIILED
jgi:cytochrome c oxidase assembly protein subunit 15